MSRIEKRLRETMGLDSASIGAGAIQRTVRLRMKSLGLKNADEYARVLDASPTEWNELLESVVVTETWFFRDQEPFTALARLVGEAARLTSGPLRLLSLPCSTGEEPYSLAMAVRDAGLPLERIQIDAADISARALARARLALYTRNSFRGKELGFRDRYFHQTKEGFALDPDIRVRVNFIEGNLLTSDFLSGKAGYDYIFCRNLLIYFDRPTQAKALAKLDRLLAPRGVLFVGPAEQPLAMEHGFVPANIPMAFACRKAGASGSAPAVRQRPVRAAKSAPFLPTSLKTPDLPAPPRVNINPPGGNRLGLAVKPAQSKLPDLDQARRLADAGRLKEAAEICEAHLREHGPSAKTYYLLGLIRDAGSDLTAIDYYRKALYLEPDHYETLLQMALLAQKNGDLARARTYRNRAQRIKAKPD
jgi:chemotaxis protein methyltransferase WspC